MVYPQSNVPVDPRAGVPSRVGHLRMIHPHGQYVFYAAEAQVRRQVVLEARIAAWPPTHELAVDPHFRIVVDAVELYG